METSTQKMPTQSGVVQTGVYVTMTPLRIRIPPEREFMEIAEDCIDNGTFDEAIRRIIGKLVEASRTNNRSDTAYYTKAFKTFLKFHGGAIPLPPSL